MVVHVFSKKLTHFFNQEKHSDCNPTPLKLFSSKLVLVLSLSGIHRACLHQPQATCWSALLRSVPWRTYSRPSFPYVATECIDPEGQKRLFERRALVLSPAIPKALALWQIIWTREAYKVCGCHSSEGYFCFFKLCALWKSLEDRPDFNNFVRALEDFIKAIHRCRKPLRNSN